MRHTLLPDNLRVSIRREYRIKLIIVFCLMLTVAGVIGIVALFPSFIHAYSTQQSRTSSVSSTDSAKDKEYAKMKAEFASDYTQLRTITPYTKSSDPSEFINSIIDLKGNIKINSIAFSRDASTTISLIIRGIAPTRASLLVFKDKIESLDNTTVDLPVSELTKSVDAPFSMQINQKLL